ncbi:MAG: hypothetical protein FWD94_01230 [Treponema sp.]|nr:hypothetical protein [Treponema sp.]
MGERMLRPVLEVSVAGSVPEARPSVFRLVTDREYRTAVASLEFPRDAEVGGKGDPVTVHLSGENGRSLLFTGEVLSAAVTGGLRFLRLADGHAKLCRTAVTAAYRKETAEAILGDALDAAGIGARAITCPAVEVARFSTGTVPADRLIELLVKTLEEHGHRGLRFFFDEADTFRFGTCGDTGRHEGGTYEFRTRRDIVARGEDRIEVLPLPIRHSMPVTVDGTGFWVRRTELRLSGSRSGLRLWLSEEG